MRIVKKKLYLIRNVEGKYLQNSFSGPKWVSNREVASSWEDNSQAQKIASYYDASIETY